ncbi:MAG TPA: fibronectin type III domain-containing protein [Acidimicrobiales bacterium]|nr:fibronectin type III domain-containing protein [Acidimicrobiales bacterium]
MTSVPPGSTQAGGTRRRTSVFRLLGRHLIAVFSIVIALLVATGGVVAAYASLTATGQGQSQAKTLGAPTGLTTNGAPTSTKIKIKWTAPTTPTPSGYVVYRCSGAGCTPTSANTITSGGCKSSVTAPLVATTCTDTGLPNSTTYAYAVAAVYHKWVSVLSAKFQATTTIIIVTNTSCTVKVTTNTHVATKGCTAAANAKVTTLPLYAPTDITTGDVLIAQLTARVSHTKLTSVTAPAGWTLIATASYKATGTIFQDVYYCVVGRGTGCKKTQASWSWSWVSTQTPVPDASGGIFQFSGVTPTSPVDVAKATHGGSTGWLTATAPSVTTTAAGDEIVVLFASGGKQSFTTATCSSAAGDTMKIYYSARSLNTAAASGKANAYESDALGCATTAVQAAAGATNTFKLTQTTGANSTYAWDSATIALKPS